ncbi:hypothetical protein LXL04_002710 [Taraxacum kok-saghyz]
MVPIAAAGAKMAVAVAPRHPQLWSGDLLPASEPPPTETAARFRPSSLSEIFHSTSSTPLSISDLDSPAVASG